MRSSIFLIIAILAVFTLSGCFDTEVELEAAPSVNILYPQPEDAELTRVDAEMEFAIEYAWKVGENFKAPGKNLRVFVHFVDENGNIIIGEDGSTIQDDHEPPIPVTEWKAGEDVVYSRSRLIFPESLGAPPTRLKILMGLYDMSDNERATLLLAEDIESKNKSYLVETIEVTTNPTLNPIFNESWHGPEPGGDTMPRWTKKESTVTFIREPWIEAADLWVAGHSPIEDLGDSVDYQRLSIYIHEKKPENIITGSPLVFAKPDIDIKDKRNYYRGERLHLTRIPLPQHLFDTNMDQSIKLIIEVDRFYTPGGDDDRQELGFRFDTMYLNPKLRQR